MFIHELRNTEDLVDILENMGVVFKNTENKHFLVKMSDKLDLYISYDSVKNLLNFSIPSIRDDKQAEIIYNYSIDKKSFSDRENEFLEFINQMNSRIIPEILLLENSDSSGRNIPIEMSIFNFDKIISKVAIEIDKKEKELKFCGLDRCLECALLMPIPVLYKNTPEKAIIRNYKSYFTIKIQASNKRIKEVFDSISPDIDDCLTEIGFNDIFLKEYSGYVMYMGEDCEIKIYLSEHKNGDIFLHMSSVYYEDIRWGTRSHIDKIEVISLDSIRKEIKDKLLSCVESVEKFSNTTRYNRILKILK